MSKRTVGMLVLWSGLAVSMGSCGEEPASLRSIRAAGTTIAEAAGGAPAAIDAEYLNRKLGQAVAELQKSKGDGKDALSSASAVLLSAAQLGQSTIPATQVEAIENRARGLSSRISSLLGLWNTYNAMASSSRVDVGPRLEEIARARRELAARIESASKAGAEAGREQEVLTARAKGLRDQSAAAERAAIELKESTRGMSLSEATPILERSLAERAKADGLTLEAGRASADALLFEPRKVQALQAVEELRKQEAALGREAERLAERSRSAALAERQSTEKAGEIAREIAALTAELDELRGKELSEAFEAAASACESAARTAPASDRGGAGTVAGARAKFLLGEVLSARARESDSYAALMSALAGSSDRLPESGAYAERAKSASEAAKAFHERAREAYADAVTKFQSVNPKGEDTATLRDALVKRLASAGGVSMASGGGDAGDGAPVADGDDVGAIRLLLAEMKRVGDESDVDRMASLIYAGSEGQANFDAVMSMARAMSRLDAAMKSKFGKGVNDLGGMAGGGGNPAAMFAGAGSVDDLSGAEIVVTGDTASMEVTGADEPTLFRKVGGVWKVDASEQLSDPMMAMVTGSVGKLVETIDGLTGEVESGALDSLEKVSGELMKRMMKAMMPGGTPGMDGEDGDE
ncbi:MAG: hypothetical protein HRU70_06205 [Phycisphaeraceae bacterium]|nr:MAG: hypothetical protein HRU70_06205 [Phycisphaeraceae bacterium]